MTLTCPHCEQDIAVPKPWEFMGFRACPSCGRFIYVEVDEDGSEGATFTAHKKPPDCRLYPPNPEARREP